MSTTEFPDHIYSGVAGEFASMYSDVLESPKQFFFTNFLTYLGAVMSDRIEMKTEVAQQPRIYMLNLGESSDTRKSTSINKTRDFFKEYISPDIQRVTISLGVGSAEGLQEEFARVPGNSVLMLIDEFAQLINKMKIQNSTLLQCVNTLYESNYYGNAIRGSSVQIDDGRLSMIGASTLDTYEDVWSSAFTSIGFNNRLFLVPGFGERKGSVPPPIPDGLKIRIYEQLRPMLSVSGKIQLDMDPDAFLLYDEWYHNREDSQHAKRLESYALRFMPLIALNDGTDRITKDVAKRVIDLMDWQLIQRTLYDPIDADNTIAKIEEKIRKYLQVEPRNERDLKRLVHYERFGLHLYNAAIKNLLESNEIVKRDGVFILNVHVGAADIKVLQDFLRDNTYRHPLVSVEARVLYKTYRNYIRKNKFHTIGYLAFEKALDRSGVDLVKVNGVPYVNGITMKNVMITNLVEDPEDHDL